MILRYVFKDQIDLILYLFIILAHIRRLGMFPLCQSTKGRSLET